MTPFHWLLVIYLAVGAALTAIFRKFYRQAPISPEDAQNPPIATSTDPVAEPRETPVKPASNNIYSTIIYSTAVAHLGQHLTLDASVPDEVGCCEAVSAVLKDAGFVLPAEGIAGVNALIVWLLANGFTEQSSPSVGAIITAHNPDAAITTYAHTGICLAHGIASNNSATGIFSENYTLASWHAYFGAAASTTRYFAVVDNGASTVTGTV